LPTKIVFYEKMEENSSAVRCFSYYITRWFYTSGSYSQLAV